MFLLLYVLPMAHAPWYLCLGHEYVFFSWLAILGQSVYQDGKYTFAIPCVSVPRASILYVPLPKIVFSVNLLKETYFLHSSITFVLVWHWSWQYLCSGCPWIFELLVKWACWHIGERVPCCENFNRNFPTLWKDSKWTKESRGQWC